MRYIKTITLCLSVFSNACFMLTWWRHIIVDSILSTKQNCQQIDCQCIVTFVPLHQVMNYFLSISLSFILYFFRFRGRKNRINKSIDRKLISKRKRILIDYKPIERYRRLNQNLFIIFHQNFDRMCCAHRIIYFLALSVVIEIEFSILINDFYIMCLSSSLTCALQIILQRICWNDDTCPLSPLIFFKHCLIELFTLDIFKYKIAYLQ